MKEQLALLLKLQSSDVKVRELEASLVKLPARLDPIRRDLAKLQTMIAGERTRLGETENWKKEQETALERDHDGLKHAKGKLQATKNTKEYGAASREVDHKKKSISDREAELKKISEAISKTSGDATAHDADVAKLAEHLASEEAAIADELGKLRDELASSIVVRDDARTHVEIKWLKIYDSLVGKKGYAVAPVVKGVCRGCHMALPPQLNNILARLESIETCPRCGRMVYREEMFAPVIANDSLPPA